jgi:hypothetical protein
MFLTAAALSVQDQTEIGADALESVATTTELSACV